MSGHPLAQVNVKTEWFHQVQCHRRSCASPGYATSVLRDLGIHQNQIEVLAMISLPAQQDTNLSQ